MLKRFRKLWCLTPFFSFLTIACAEKENVVYRLKVLSVYDGDTFSANNKKFRLFGVDTPELSNKNNAFQKTTGLERHFGLLARNFSRKKILGQTVQITSIATDIYKRVVAKVKTDKDLGFMLVQKGLAKIAYFDISNYKSPFYSQDYSYYQKLSDAQHKAYTSLEGFWLYKDNLNLIFPNSK